MHDNPIGGGVLGASVLVLALALAGSAQQVDELHGSRPETLEIRGAHVLIGDGSPASGPRSVFVRDGKIVAGRIASPAAVIDGRGCYLLPGLVSTHAHLHKQAAGIPMRIEYILKLWLCAGITSIRDLGSAFGLSLRLRARTARGELAGPRIFLFRGFGAAHDPEAARRRVRSYKTAGADGIKLWSNFSYRREVLAAILAEARESGLPVTAHIGVGETNARDYSELGVGSIEHWYGIPDAALNGVQDFPPDFSYSNEVDRFRYAGQLWRQADPDKLEQVLSTMVSYDVSWSPTLAIYEASRDLVRAQNKPWFREYLHPALRKFFTPNLDYHGSYFIGWTTADEVAWRQNYRIWMRALRRFAALGGNVTTGEGAGYIYVMYGFGLIRELELHLEAGFHPLEVIRHATYNGAKALGQQALLGRVLPGLAADLCLVRGNPLANLKLFYPTGADRYVDGKSRPDGGVQFTIKDGRIYHGPTLRDDVKQMVQEASR